MDSDGLEVRWWQYDGEKRSGIDFGRVNARRWLGTASVFRIVDRTSSGTWYIAIVGRPEKVATAAKRIKHGRRIYEEPEPGLGEATKNRHIRHLLIGAATGQTIGERHYEHGAEVDRSGKLEPRERREEGESW